jgi:hypothetical protein
MVMAPPVDNHEVSAVGSEITMVGDPDGGGVTVTAREAMAKPPSVAWAATVMVVVPTASVGVNAHEDVPVAVPDPLVAPLNSYVTVRMPSGWYAVPARGRLARAVVHERSVVGSEIAMVGDSDGGEVTVTVREAMARLSSIPRAVTVMVVVPTASTGVNAHEDVPMAVPDPLVAPLNSYVTVRMPSG